MTPPPSPNRSLDRQVLLGVAAVLAVLLMIRGYTRSQVMAVDAASEWVDHTHRVLQAVATVDARLADARLGERRVRPARGSSSAGVNGAAIAGVDEAITRLRALTRDNADQQPRVDSLQALARHLLAVTDHDTQDELMQPYRAVSARISATEEALLAERAARRMEERRDLSKGLVWSGVFIVLLTLAAAVRVRSALLVRARAEQERDEHARALVQQSAALEQQNRELMAQGQALRAAMDQAEAANQAKSMFLAQMSHELRTPLNSVIGFANIVRRNANGALSATELIYLERIAANGAQLLRTINTILDLSKIEADQERVELELVSLDQLVREVLAQLEPQAAAGGVVMSTDLPAPLAAVVTDSEKLRRVLINLVANAVKFTRAGGTVTVTIATAPSARTTPVAIEVRDSGIGIAHDRLASIFEAFEQGDMGVAREFGGTGLGLSISRALCRLLRCDLTVSSVPGEGSVFRIALPLDGAFA